ncbi:hypothetical protein LTS18_008153 [Coniosporium uncinatum]|uniref:Uncharacterized protein n=1 Tax=Coniosporium uncinatum TaxID=93489 RepID=A0ACC3DZ53_9PEZI|nr:hypothetical protein LTS18_008153 [Coniosporium uncinatum]
MPAISAETGQYAEWAMREPSVRVRQRSSSERLDPMSRVNFAKVYTVEHNVKVYNFGMVDADCMQIFLDHFNTVWNIGRANV